MLRTCTNLRAGWPWSRRSFCKLPVRSVVGVKSRACRKLKKGGKNSCKKLGKKPLAAAQVSRAGNTDHPVRVYSLVYRSVFFLRFVAFFLPFMPFSTTLQDLSDTDYQYLQLPRSAGAMRKRSRRCSPTAGSRRQRGPRVMQVYIYIYISLYILFFLVVKIRNASWLTRVQNL